MSLKNEENSRRDTSKLITKFYSNNGHSMLKGDFIEEISKYLKLFEEDNAIKKSFVNFKRVAIEM
jgi:hypothetical protein